MFFISWIDDVDEKGSNRARDAGDEIPRDMRDGRWDIAADLADRYHAEERYGKI